jgi:hypothetical protein
MSKSVKYFSIKWRTHDLAKTQNRQCYQGVLVNYLIRPILTFQGVAHSYCQ